MSHIPRISICSESSVVVTFGDAIDLETHRKVMSFHHWLLKNPFPGLLAVVPAYASVTVFFDPVLVKENWSHISPAHTIYAFLEEKLQHFNTQPLHTQTLKHSLIEIPVQYNGPDLSNVAERLQLSENEVIGFHSGAVYTVFMIGFLPGFPYLGRLREELVLPRRDTPRVRVPAGSVAIAGWQTGIYPQASPGGWHLIGHTDTRLFDPSQRPPATLQPGMRVRFVKV